MIDGVNLCCFLDDVFLYLKRIECLSVFYLLTICSVVFA